MGSRLASLRTAHSGGLRVCALPWLLSGTASFDCPSQHKPLAGEVEACSQLLLSQQGTLSAAGPPVWVAASGPR